MNLPLNVSQATKRRNPALYPSVGGLEAGQSERAEALEPRPQKQPRGTNQVAIRVSLVTFRARLLDDDNNVSSLKPLRDAIAETIGIDDGDIRIRWQYGQIETRGRQGVVVRIEV